MWRSRSSVLHLNAYVPVLQVGGQVIRFLHGHLGFEIPSPTLLGPIGNRFRGEVKAFAAEREVPVQRPRHLTQADRRINNILSIASRQASRRRSLADSVE
jgi:hypothetical protein